MEQAGIPKWNGDRGNIMGLENSAAPVQRITQPPHHHFFGYYDKCPWDHSGRRILAMQSGFADRNPTPDDRLTIGFVDLDEACRFRPLATTTAWNWQQGCMLRWLPPRFDDTILFNDRRLDKYVCVAMNVESGDVQEWPWPIYDIARDGRQAATLNFARITTTRPGYGYFGLPDPHVNELEPENDGLFIVDVDRQTRRLAMSIRDAIALGRIKPPAGYKSWFNHVQFNPSGTRLIFLHRWAAGPVPGHVGFFTRMIAVNVDGTEPVSLLEGIKISHFDWYDDEHLIVWLESLQHAWKGYHLVNVRTGNRIMFANGVFESDGHCVLNGDRRWMLTDTYPQGPAREQRLMLYRMDTGQVHRVGCFPALPVENDSWRCDLHARWNRTGEFVCFDSTHEGSRQMYIADVSAITGRIDEIPDI